MCGVVVFQPADGGLVCFHLVSSGSHCMLRRRGLWAQPMDKQLGCVVVELMFDDPTNFLVKVCHGPGMRRCSG